VSVKVVVLVTPSKAAVTVTVAEVAEGRVVVIVKVADVAPAGIVTVVGAVTFPWLSVIVTVIPPLGAGELIVTVPVALLLPTTELGETETLTSSGLRTTN
jgi:hypothetical protein